MVDAVGSHTLANACAGTSRRWSIWSSSRTSSRWLIQRSAYNAGDYTCTKNEAWAFQFYFDN